ncbi:MAG: PHP domain-containing protein, partial [Bacteroidota bacterium]
LTTAPLEEVMEMLSESPFEQLEEVENIIHAKTTAGTLFQISFAEKNNFFKNLFITTGNDLHVDEVKKRIADFDSKNFSSEEEIYQAANLQFVLPELREGLNEIELATQNNLPELIEPKEILGVVHAHSIWSDGINSIEEMARYSMKLGYEYLFMSDHSQTAVYAKGLSRERVLQQHEEIDLLNKKLSPFKIFKGIESDILNDGSLDYDEDILSRFDFVIASIHQNFKMSEEKATARLIRAIENPYTTILGHPTGRLLLSRPGYPVNHKEIIDAAAKNNVIIEINAHPWRLDIDWRWIQYAMEKNVLISINPDAHNTSGIHDIHYGTLAARKGMLTKTKTFNTKSLSEVEQYISNRKSMIRQMAVKQ